MHLASCMINQVRMLIITVLNFKFIVILQEVYFNYNCYMAIILWSVIAKHCWCNGHLPLVSPGLVWLDYLETAIDHVRPHLSTMMV